MRHQALHYMKNQLLLSLLLSVFTTGSLWAQDVPVATLHHEEATKIFYGREALSHALLDADQGDLITLSPGIFSVPQIDKAVTIQGAGYVSDPKNGVYRTQLIPSPSIYMNGGFTLEGIYIDQSISFYGNIKGCSLKTCRFADLFFEKNSEDVFNRAMPNFRFIEYKNVSCKLSGE